MVQSIHRDFCRCAEAIVYALLLSCAFIVRGVFR